MNPEYVCMGSLFVVSFLMYLFGLFMGRSRAAIDQAALMVAFTKSKAFQDLNGHELDGLIKQDRWLQDHE